jgi:photosystem II stability/assembly factor-like uncharacterized protein
MSSSLNELDFASSTQGYACGDNGAVFSVTPEGVANLNSGLATNLYDISASSVDNVWVCGGGTISHYNGTGFEFQSGPSGSYNSIFFINDNEGWVVGNVGLIGYTEDGGDNWHRQINSDDNSLYSVFFYDENDGWAVGINGVILKTSDGGENWQIEGAGLTINLLTGIHFTSPINGYVVGNGKTLLKYTEVSGIGDNIQNLAFEVYPNPCRDGIIQIAVYNIQYTNCCLEVLDLSGRAVVNTIEGWAEEHSIRLDISHLSSGIYFIRVNLENQTIVKKIIKQ